MKRLAPATEVVTDDYHQDSPEAPSLTGTGLKLFIRLLESRFFGLIAGKFLRDNGHAQLFDETFIPEAPTFRPNTTGWQAEEENPGAFHPIFTGTDPVKVASQVYDLCTVNQSTAPWRRYGIADYYEAYSSGASTPTQVAESIIAAVDKAASLQPRLIFFYHFDPQHLRDAAAASTARWASGRPLSPLDGVPFGVKDLEDVEGMPTTGGTSFLQDYQPNGVAYATSPCAAALEAAGGLLLGKLATHEIGIGVTGLNTVQGTPRNPYDISRHTGGSSSGTASAVSAGLCPFGIGSDGGGSIRIPSSLCGVVGLKPTHDRLDISHSTPVDATVAVLGPIAASTVDCAIAYAIMATAGGAAVDNDAGKLTGLPQPALRPATVNLPVFGQSETCLRGKTIGIYGKWFEHATPEVVAACKAAVGLLESAGLMKREIVLPELKELHLAHGVTITSEMRSFMAASLHDGALRPQLNGETRATLGFAGVLSGAYYVSAQRIRTRGEFHFRRTFRDCDLIATPATPQTAPAIKSTSLRNGLTDLSTTMMLMRYVVPCNYLGFPGISVPVGVDAQGLPIGLQLFAPPWHEATLLHCAALLEKKLAKPMPKPTVWFDILGKKE